jgi:hypothetical protein
MTTAAHTMWKMLETVETVNSMSALAATSLKRGVNEILQAVVLIRFCI